MSSAPATYDVPPPEYHAQEPPPAEGRTRSKSSMGLAGPVMPYPKDEKSHYPESNIGVRAKTWGYVHKELYVDGAKQPQTATSITYSEGHRPVTQFSGFDTSKPLLSEKNGGVPCSLQAHLNAEGQYVIESESFIWNPDMLRNIVAALMEKHPRFTFTYDPTSGHPGNGWELEQRDGGDNITYYPPWTKMGKLPDRIQEIMARKERTIYKRGRWQCCECGKRIREAEEDEEIPVMDSEDPECRKCGHKHCETCPDRGNEFWQVLRDD